MTKMTEIKNSNASDGPGIEGNNFLTENGYQNTITILCTLAGTTFMIILAFMVCRKAKTEREQEVFDRVDENPIYGIYQVKYNKLLS